MSDSIYDSTIIWDEAYQDLSSRNWKTFTIEDHKWFATNGHNLNDVWIVVQNPARVDTVIREMANYFIYMQKTYAFFRMGFLWFTAKYYIRESDINMSRKGMDLSYFKDRLTMRSDVMQAYDTHFFRNPAPEKKYETWTEKYNIPLAPEKFSLNYGKGILILSIILGIYIFLYIVSKIFL